MIQVNILKLTFIKKLKKKQKQQQKTQYFYAPQVLKQQQV